MPAAAPAIQTHAIITTPEEIGREWGRVAISDSLANWSWYMRTPQDIAAVRAAMWPDRVGGVPAISACQGIAWVGGRLRWVLYARIHPHYRGR